jgi:hypothetical protein
MGKPPSVPTMPPSDNLSGSGLRVPAFELQRVTAGRAKSFRTLSTHLPRRASTSRKGAILPPGEHGQAPRSRARETDLRNIPGSKSGVKKVLRSNGRAGRSYPQRPELPKALCHLPFYTPRNGIAIVADLAEVSRQSLLDPK